MPAKGSPDQYLKRIKDKWYVSITVPRTLQHIHSTHIRQSLRTGDRVEANKRKYPVVAQIKAKLAWDKANLLSDGTLPQMRKHPEAVEYRDAIVEAEASGNHEVSAIIRSKVADKAQHIEDLHGEAVAQDFVDRATATGGTLNELAEKWLAESDCTTGTKDGYSRSVREFLEFNRKSDVLPAAVKLAHAIAFIDGVGGLKARELDSKTIGKKLGALRLFWQWMESKMHIPEGTRNPWANHKISAKKHKGKTPEKRAFSDAEMLAILNANDRVRTWPQAKHLPDLSVLGLYSGARIEELCSMARCDVQKIGSAYVMRTAKAKTRAGRRDFAFTAAAPCEILDRRMAKNDDGGMLFPELKRGGLDEKFSQSSSKRFTEYRRACGVTDGADFHSFRRVLITVLTKAGTLDGRIARFVGHKVNNMAGDVYYSKLPDPDTAIETARKIVYPIEIEAAALASAKRAG